jgi:hypothetical protein
LNKRIQSSSLTVMVLAAGIFVPMAVVHSNKKQVMHLPTVLVSYATFLSGLSLRGLVFEFLDPKPGRRRYVAIKTLVHVCALLLVSLSFSLSLMMRMYVVVTTLSLAFAAALIAQRLWQCALTELDQDVEACKGCDEVLLQLLELSTNVTSMLFGGWFGMAFFYFQNYPEEARDARFLPSEYLTFFTSVASSLMLLKAVQGKPSLPAEQNPAPEQNLALEQKPARELMTLICALVTGVVVTALVIAASMVGGYFAVALVPEGVALAWWWRTRLASDRREPPEPNEPPSHNFVSVLLTLLLAVLTYRAKDVEALSSLYDEVFVLGTTAAVVAALAWRLLTQPPTPTRDPEVQAAAKVLALSTFCLLVLSALAFLGVMFGY